MSNSPLPLPPDVQDRLRAILLNSPPFSAGGGRSLTLFLGRARVPDSVSTSYNWQLPATEAVGQLLAVAERYGLPLSGGRPGYTVLGMVLDQLLREDALGQAEGLYLARIIHDYGLIDLDRAAISDQLRALLPQVPAAPLPNLPPPPSPPPVNPPPDAAQLRAAITALIGTLDEIGNPELVDKARELRAAFAQPELDLEHITTLRYWFRGRAAPARDAAAAFFATPVVRQMLTAAAG